MSETLLPPSPGSQEHVSIALTNSALSLSTGIVHDELDTPQTTTTWLIEHELVGEGSVLQSYCQNRLVGLRGVVQAAFAAQTEGIPVAPGVIDGINAALTAAPQAALLRHSTSAGFFRIVEHPVTQLVEHAMSLIAEDAAELLADARSEMLARCEAAPCTRFFLRTHARRQWCSTRCGDRVRAARAYARKRATSQGVVVPARGVLATL